MSSAREEALRKVRDLTAVLHGPEPTRAEWLSTWLAAKPLIEAHAFEGAPEPWVRIGVARGWLAIGDTLP